MPVFAGLLELVGAVLLFWRRTTTLGALLCAAVLANVVMLNFCFDVPVKLLSSHLLLMSLGLVALDARRLLDLLVRNRPTEPQPHKPHFEGRRLHVAGRVLEGLAIASLLAPNAVVGTMYFLETHGATTPRSPYYGIYQVEDMREDGQLRPGLISDPARWRYLVFDRPDALSVVLMDGSIERYSVEIELKTETMMLWPRGDFYERFRFDRPEPEEPIKHEWRVVSAPDQLELIGELRSSAGARRQSPADRRSAHLSRVPLDQRDPVQPLTGRAASEPPPRSRRAATRSLPFHGSLGARCTLAILEQS